MHPIADNPGDFQCIADIDKYGQTVSFQEIAAADSVTWELAGTGGLLCRRQNHREMPAGAIYYYKGRNKGRFRGIILSQLNDFL